MVEKRFQEVAEALRNDEEWEDEQDEERFWEEFERVHQPNCKK